MMGNLLHDNTVNQDDIRLDDAVKLVFGVLKKQGKPLSDVELQLKTGLSLFGLEDALNVLFEQYVCRLQVNEKGQIVYDFDLKRKRNQKLWTDHLKTVLSFLVQLFVFVFKLVTTLVFFSYALTVGVGLAVLFSALAKSAQPIAFLFLALFEAVRLLFVDIKSFFSKEKTKTRPLDSENLIHLVFVYVFGYDPFVDDLELERNILNYIRKVNNRITATDLMAITGWNIQKCNAELTLMLTHYRGKVYVTDEGVIIYHFPEFEQPVAVETTENKKFSDFYIWNKKINDGLSYRNKKEVKIVGGVAIFSLIVSAILILFVKSSYHLQYLDFVELLIFRGQEMLGMSVVDSRWATVALYLFLFFAAYLFVSLITRARENNRAEKIRQLKRKYQYLKKVFGLLPRVPLQLFDLLTDKQTSNFAFDYGGELKIDETDAGLYYDFANMQLEIDAAFAERSVGLEGIDKLDRSEVSHIPKKNVEKNVSEAKKGVRKSSKKRVFRWGFIAFFVFVAVFFSDILAVFKTNLTSEFHADSKLEVDHASFLYPLYNTDAYELFEELTIENASEDRPVPEFDTISKFKYLKIHGAPKVVLPKKMNALEQLDLKDIDGMVIFPKKFGRLQHLLLENIKYDVSLGSKKNSYLYTLELRNIEGEIFLDYTSVDLNKLVVVGCGLTDSVAMQFDKFEGIRELDLSDNKLTQIPRWIGKQDHLQNLNLEKNQITSFPHFLKNIPDLYKVNLSENQISLLPDSIHLSYITELNLNKNKISTIPRSFGAYKCGDLLLDDNQIEAIPEPDTVPKLMKLSLARNKITEMPRHVSKLRNLNSLDVAYNQIDAFGDSTYVLKVRYLDVSGNKIKVLPPELYAMDLRELKIAFNPIEKADFEHDFLYYTNVYVNEDLPKDVLNTLKKRVGVERLHYVRGQ